MWESGGGPAHLWRKSGGDTANEHNVSKVEIGKVILAEEGACVNQ